jgi:signal transduction histidine kinase
LEDWSAVAHHCEELGISGVDLRARLDEDEQLLRELIEEVVVLDVNGKAVDFAGASGASDLIGELPTQLFAAGPLGVFIDQIMAVAEHRTELVCDVSGLSMDGSGIDFRLHWAAPLLRDTPDYSNVIVMMVDTRAHKVAEREMFKLIDDMGEHLDAEQRIHDHVRRLESLIDMGRSLASTFDRDEQLELVVTIAQQVIGAEDAVIHLFDQEREEVLAVAGSGLPQGVLGSCPYREVMDGLCGWMARTREATIVADLTNDDRIGLGHECVGLHRIGTAAAGAPIILDGEVVGSLVVVSAQGSEFNEMDLSLVRMTAAQTAVGLHNAELYERVSRSRDEAHRAHRELKDAQIQLLQAQKLEAIGSLAAGIAHEINTPIQFILDNVSFIEDAIGPLAESIHACSELVAAIQGSPDVAEHVARIEGVWTEKDCWYLLEEMPDAVAETMEGARRVAEIVRAMKDFAHPGSEEKHLVDINRLVRTTVEVSRNEWKYTAELTLDLDDELPEIMAHAGPLGQALLIMIVNGAQALEQQGAGGGAEKGTIRISTALTQGIVEIRVADDGPGIPPEILDRIFDPFFTTKEVGKGTGQGLSIAHSVVVDKHGGEIVVEDGRPGAVFVVRLPVSDEH